MSDDLLSSAISNSLDPKKQKSYWKRIKKESDRAIEGLLSGTTSQDVAVAAAAGALVEIISNLSLLADSELKYLQFGKNANFSTKVPVVGGSLFTDATKRRSLKRIELKGLRDYLDKNSFKLAEHLSVLGGAVSPDVRRLLAEFGLGIPSHSEAPPQPVAPAPIEPPQRKNKAGRPQKESALLLKFREIAAQHPGYGVNELCKEMDKVIEQTSGTARERQNNQFLPLWKKKNGERFTSWVDALEYDKRIRSTKVYQWVHINVIQYVQRKESESKA